MNTFLPTSYRFSPNKVLNDILKYSFTHPKSSILVHLLWILTLIFVLLLMGMLITPKSYYDVSLRVIACAGIMLSGTMAIFNYPLTYSSYTAEQFKFAGKRNLSVRMFANGPKPTKIDDHKPYPYKLYYNEKGDGYLEVMTNGKFTPGTEEQAMVEFIRDNATVKCDKYNPEDAYQYCLASKPLHFVLTKLAEE